MNIKHQLLIDIGSIPECYTILELRNRLHYYLPLRGYKPALIWKKQWLKGVELINDNRNKQIRILYYGIPVFIYDKQTSFITDLPR